MDGMEGMQYIAPKPSVKPIVKTTTTIATPSSPPSAPSPAFDAIRKRLKLTHRQITQMPSDILAMSEDDERACHAFLNSGKGNGLLITMLMSGTIPDPQTVAARASPGYDPESRMTPGTAARALRQLREKYGHDV